MRSGIKIVALAVDTERPAGGTDKLAGGTDKLVCQWSEGLMSTPRSRPASKPLTSCGSLSVAPLRSVPPLRSVLPWRMLAVLALLFFSSGCEERIDTAYGGRTGPLDGPSVNGTAVFADMLAEAGHNVLSRTSLSPGLEDSADVMIWFPDDFRVPNPQVIGWLENWLTAKSGRTVVYVGRDFDAAIEYWKAVAPIVPAAQQADAKSQLDEAESDFSQARSSVLDGESCNWFTVKTLPMPRPVTTLTGPWSAGIDVKKTDIRLYSTYQFDPSDEVLLAGNTDTLVARRRFSTPDSWSASIPSNQLIVVTNGSFLLNLQLVNHEHRKLAARLMSEIPPASRIVFLESGPGGPPIRESDPVARPPNGLAVFSIWPLGGVLLHLAVIGVLFCFARLPIFGVPRDPPETSRSDFSKHVAAFGELLHLTSDRGYAQARIDQYRGTTHGTPSATGQKPRPGLPNSDH